MTFSVRSEIKKIVAFTLVASIGLGVGYSYFLEPDIARAVTDAVVVTLNVDAGISITSPADTSMSRNLGVAIDTAIATTTWNVKTNNTLGYTMTVAASSLAAMKHSNGTDQVLDYSTTPSLWSVTAGNAAFGFSAFGTDLTGGAALWGTGTQCASTAHTPSATLKYRGFANTSQITVAGRSSTTTTTGVDTTICYAVEQDTYYIPSGTYTATITATATTL